RGVPQIEVTFDIDANGIVHVTAKDKGTGKENTIIIQDGSGLSKEEIDQMIKDAEEHAAEDAKRREEADARNQAESTVYQTEKFVSENEDKIPADKKDSLNAAIAEAKTALEGSDVDAIKAAVEKVNTEAQAVGQAIYEASAAEGAEAGDASTAGAADDDVVDAEVVDEDEGKGESK
ncbi:MAG: Hsp70 family protein, partial [Dietzia sp.]